MGNLLDKVNTCRRRLKNLDNAFGDRDPRVVIVGLDGAGKTSILYKAKLDDAIFANMPPRGINIEMMTPKRGCRIQVYDLPGHKMTRHLWHNWFMGTEAIVYVVDSGDSVRIDEAKFELHDLLKSRYLRRVPLIVLANKQDADEAMNPDIVSAELDLSTISDRDWSIHATNGEKGKGIMTAFQDVVEKIKTYRQYKSGLVSKDELIKQSDIQKDIEEKPEQTVTTDENNTDTQTNIPSLFATINKETELDSEGEEGITKDDDEINDKSGNGSNGSAEYDRPAHLGEVNVDVSSNENGSEKDAVSDDEESHITEETHTKSDANVVEASNDKTSDTRSEGNNSFTEKVEVHSAENSDANTNNDSDSESINNNGSEISDVIDLDAPKHSEKVTDLDAYSNDSELDLSNDGTDTMDKTYEFEANAPIAVV